MRIPACQRSREHLAHLERVFWIDLLTLLTLAGFTLYATVAEPAEIDFIASWGLKGRIFALHGGIDWSFLDIGRVRARMAAADALHYLAPRMVERSTIWRPSASRMRASTRRKFGFGVVRTFSLPA